MVSGRPPLDIAIVGCGPSGMAAALFLRRDGHRVTIFERFREPRPVGAGLLLQPTGLAVLARLGLRDRIAAAGARIDRLDGRTAPDGRRILDVAYAELGGDLHGIGIHRASLFDALQDALIPAGVDIVSSTTVATIEDAASRRSEIVDDKGRRHGRFDIVVDAAGAQSPLRAKLGRKQAAPFAYGALWTILPLGDHSSDRIALEQRYVAARRMIGVMPVGVAPGARGPHAALFWSIRRDQLDGWRRRGLSAWKEEMEAIWPEAAAFASAIDDNAQMVPAFYGHYTARMPVAGSIAAIGDAAHSTSPQLGQGANMGLLDAYALAVALAREASVEAGLAAYAAERKRHVRFYQMASWWLTPLFQSDSVLAARMRDLTFPAADRVPYFRRETARALAGLKTGMFRRVDLPQL